MNTIVFVITVAACVANVLLFVRMLRTRRRYLDQIERLAKMWAASQPPEGSQRGGGGGG
jgi:hypothetical protein